MTKALIAAAALGLSIAGANACEFQRTAGAQTDNMTVASTATIQSMSTPETTVRTDVVRTDQVKDDAVLTDDRG